ncbi:hypothetical protein ACPV5S_15775 [Vibrio astriarenae]
MKLSESRNALHAGHYIATLMVEGVERPPQQLVKVVFTCEGLEENADTHCLMYDNYTIVDRHGAQNSVGVQRLFELANACGIRELVDSDQLDGAQCVVFEDERSNVQPLSLADYKRKTALANMVSTSRTMTAEEAAAKREELFAGLDNTVVSFDAA